MHVKSELAMCSSIMMHGCFHHHCALFCVQMVKIKNKFKDEEVVDENMQSV